MRPLWLPLPLLGCLLSCQLPGELQVSGGFSPYPAGVEPGPAAARTQAPVAPAVRRERTWPGPDLLPGPALAYGADRILSLHGHPARVRVLTQLLGRPPARLELQDGPGDLAPIFDELTARFGSSEAAMAALFVGLEPVSRAQRRLGQKRAPRLDDFAGLDGPRRREAIAMAREALECATLFSLAWPVPRRAWISSGFGPRIHPVTGHARMHQGIDLAVPVGTEVRAPAAGVVRRLGEGRANGRWVELDHGFGIRTLFLHNSLVLVQEGDTVEPGAPISYSGDTGITTGPHLHYQVHVRRAAVDPLRFRQVATELERPAAADLASL